MYMHENAYVVAKRWAGLKLRSSPLADEDNSSNSLVDSRLRTTSQREKVLAQAQLSPSKRRELRKREVQVRRIESFIDFRAIFACWVDSKSSPYSLHDAMLPLINDPVDRTQELEVNLEVHKAQLELRWLQRDIKTEVRLARRVTLLEVGL